MQSFYSAFCRTFVSLCFMTALAVSVSAATFTVNSTANTPDANMSDATCADAGGFCTLRAAIEQANAAAGSDIINFDGAVFSTPKTISLTSAGLPQITDVLTITGVITTLLTIDGTGNFRPFDIAGGTNVGINNMTIINGFVGESDGGAVRNLGTANLNNVVIRNSTVNFGNGGGIFNSGNMSVMNSQIYDNSADNGGGIANPGTLDLNSSTVRDNTAANGNGGGIYNIGGTVAARQSTIGSAAVGGSNRASNGGGIYNENGTVNLTNSTVSGNLASNIGGGYYGFADLSATNLNAANATIANNTAVNGGGIVVSSGIGGSFANLNNTIVGDNAASGAGPDISGTISSGGYNLIENTSGGVFVPTTGDQTGVDPMLEPLADNGGTTQTHALRNNMSGVSPAIDKGNSSLSGQTNDQRGLARPVDIATIPPATGGDNADIGAFELQLGATAAVVSVSGKVLSQKGRGIARAQIVLTNASGEQRFVMTNPFGFYSFENVRTGEVYTVSVRSKQYNFEPRAVFIGDQLSNLDFVAGQ